MKRPVRVGSEEFANSKYIHISHHYNRASPLRFIVQSSLFLLSVHSFSSFSCFGCMITAQGHFDILVCQCSTLIQFEIIIKTDKQRRGNTHTQTHSRLAGWLNSVWLVSSICTRTHLYVNAIKLLQFGWVDFRYRRSRESLSEKHTRHTHTLNENADAEMQYGIRYQQCIHCSLLLLNKQKLCWHEIRSVSAFLVHIFFLYSSDGGKQMKIPQSKSLFIRCCRFSSQIVTRMQ